LHLEFIVLYGLGTIKDTKKFNRGLTSELHILYNSTLNL